MTYEQINETLNYGTDAQCRATLEEIANLMHEYNQQGLETAFTQSLEWEDAES